MKYYIIDLNDLTVKETDNTRYAQIYASSIGYIVVDTSVDKYVMNKKFQNIRKIEEIK